ncbi:hypothetical protein L195_g043226 [Trifolium pratense]|uniref:Uncharacterized protein n=1 Tax=Trifolium pratense TaxID=57577 RepID=A0A2K3KX74_TRIPR|nr:hypothetical protein L195_g057833 [Trifolium pratense]PNX87140.1 hypothetical protein L195_g043226 [Trifolium pratense]
MEPGKGTRTATRYKSNEYVFGMNGKQSRPSTAEAATANNKSYCLDRLQLNENTNATLMRAFTMMQGERLQDGVLETIEGTLYWEVVLGSMGDVNK